MKMKMIIAIVAPILFMLCAAGLMALTISGGKTIGLKELVVFAVALVHITMGSFFVTGALSRSLDRTQLQKKIDEYQDRLDAALRREKSALNIINSMSVEAELSAAQVDFWRQYAKDQEDCRSQQVGALRGFINGLEVRP